jgi:hypothetical protein
MEAARFGEMAAEHCAGGTPYQFAVEDHHVRWIAACREKNVVL